VPQFFLNKRLIVLLVCIIILVALIGFSLKDRKELTWTEQFVKDMAGLVQHLFHTPAQNVAGFFENIENLKNTYEENKMLKARLDEYVKLETKAKDLEQENKKLRELLNKQESMRDYTLIHATVIGRNPDRWHELITINKGEVHGVKKDMAVVTAKGLIGKIKHASKFTSTVQLLSAGEQTNRISAVIQGDKKVFGLIEGFDVEKGALLLREIPHNAKVEVNQNVITSGLGEVFPSGLVIGKVTEVVPDEYGLTKKAYIKPAADFYDIDHVMVVERSMISPPAFTEEDKEERK
jgi:rod shape-determining protein MreC